MPLTKPNGAAIPTDYVHGMQSTIAHSIQKGILRNRYSGAAIPTSVMHMESNNRKPMPYRKTCY